MYDIIIIGSGLSSTAFLSSLDIKNKRVAIISPSNIKFQGKVISKKLNKYLNLNLPPRFNKKKIDGYKNFFIQNRIKVNKNISIFGNLNHGGVSNYWGGSCEFPKENEISFLNKKNKKKLIDSYVDIFTKNNFYGNLDISRKKKINEKIKLKKNNINKIFQHLISDSSSKKVKFFHNVNAKNTKTGNLYLPLNINNLPKGIKKLNFVVKKIKRKNNFYSVACQNNDKTEEIFTKKLVLCSGTIASTKLICEMLNIRRSIKINHNPMLFGLFLFKQKINIENFSPSRFAAKICDKKFKKLFSIANFRTSNAIIKDKIFKNFKVMKNLFSKRLYNSLEKNFLFLNLYLDSKYGNLYFKIDNQNKTNIFYKQKSDSKIKYQLKNDMKTLYNYFKEKKLIYPFKFQLIPPWGNDNHYTGTIPINGKDKKLSLKENCELKGFKNLFVIDGSSLPNTNLKFPTALIIANAFRLGKEF